LTTFYWHDYETFGTNPRVDRPAQFAGLRTDWELNPIGDPLVIYCQPSEDYLPEPQACLITGITPQIAATKGMPEPQFATEIHSELATPETCTVGYNSIRFDDEVTRHLLYRNFIDPYGREWQQGNSRWDLIDVARLCYALRPQGTNWPNRIDGMPSFKLEDLSKANQLEHSNAHDALSDVHATIALARHLRTQQPRLFDYCLKLRDKRFARSQFDFVGLTPLVHASGKFRSERGGIALVVPLCEHPINRNGIVVFDLSASVEPLLTLSAEQIHQRVFTRSEQLASSTERIPLKTIHLNRAPVIAPQSVLRGVDTDRIQLDLDFCRANLNRLKCAADGLAEKIRQVFSIPYEPSDPVDVEAALYQRFIQASDQQLASRWRSSLPNEARLIEAKFADPRLSELAWRSRARWLPESLNEQEQIRWQTHRRERLSSRILTEYQEKLANLQQELNSPPATDILRQLAQWAKRISAGLH